MDHSKVIRYEVVMKISGAVKQCYRAQSVSVSVIERKIED